MRNKKIDWLELFVKITESSPDTQIIEFRKKELRFKYIVNLEERIGFMIIWEPTTKRAVNISRVQAPDSFPVLDINDLEAFKKEIPNDLAFENFDSSS